MTWDHKVYACEAHNRASAKQLKVLATEDLEPITDRERLMVESAYRRGYYHGWWQCYAAILCGAKGLAVCNFMERLHNWRFKKHAGKLVPPPVIQAGKKFIKQREETLNLLRLFRQEKPT